MVVEMSNFQEMYHSLHFRETSFNSADFTEHILCAQYIANMDHRLAAVSELFLEHSVRSLCQNINQACLKHSV